MAQAPHASPQGVVRETVADDMQENLLNRISWGAILAGVAAGLVTQLLLNMLGVGIGAATLDIGAGADNSGTGYSIGAGLWWALSGIIAAYIGGLTAGRLAGAASGDTSRWHGLVTWAVSTLLVIYLLSSAVGGILGGAFNVLGGAVSGAGKAAAATASGAASVTDGDALSKEARQLVDPNGAQSVQDSVTSYIKASVTGDKAETQAARTRAINGVARTAGISPQEAQARIDQAEVKAKQTYATAKAKATEAADAARKGVATASILAAIALALGALAGWMGGALGGRLHDKANIFLDRRHNN